MRHPPLPRPRGCAHQAEAEGTRLRHLLEILVFGSHHRGRLFQLLRGKGLFHRYVHVLRRTRRRLVDGVCQAGADRRRLGQGDPELPACKHPRLLLERHGHLHGTHPGSRRLLVCHAPGFRHRRLDDRDGDHGPARLQHRDRLRPLHPRDRWGDHVVGHGPRQFRGGPGEPVGGRQGHGGPRHVEGPGIQPRPELRDLRPGRHCCGHGHQ
mmetsp:Transcript_119418/g.382743  ORF Transcript_119418/g.382743 Transcript_119418/m.382743 type:complete len:210 (-) Transcript_119418:478-1107(-)